MLTSLTNSSACTLSAKTNESKIKETDTRIALVKQEWQREPRGEKYKHKPEQIKQEQAPSDTWKSASGPGGEKHAEKSEHAALAAPGAVMR